MSWKEGHISSGAAFTIGNLPNFCVFLLAFFFLINGEKGKNMMTYGCICKN